MKVKEKIMPLFFDSEKRFTIIESEKRKDFKNMKEVEVEKETRVVTERYVEQKIAYWQSIKEKILSLKLDK
ncbi:MAG: hypothetical protein ACTSUC_09735 [Promethearchaeota archaeon]